MLRYLTGFLIIGFTLGQQELKGSLSSCINGGSNINTCLAQLAERLRPYMRQGLPDYGVPPTEPMFIDEVTLSLKRPPVDVKVEFKDTTVTGLSSFRLNSVRADKISKTISLNMTVPSMNTNGQYKMTGKAFVVIKDSEGPFTVDMKEVNVKMDTQLKVQNGRLLVDGEPRVKVKVGDLNVKLSNLFGGKTPQLARTITQFLNNDSDRFIEDFGPQITSQVSRLAVNVYNTAVQDIDPTVFGLSA
eukprot:TRINITY_DN27474_c0_g1_i12.p1 TRINITY_DN27474_c0_g1~~TRINITY_DN27474_c0_g1_i12.p1  ORF type:complete len:257 (-),score=53.46 TRINITY_DN27474_c0_g1_i12:116-850(-)